MDEPARQFRISKADHTGITVSSLDEALPFWVNVLGFKHLWTTTLENNAFSENIVGVDGAAFTVAMLEGPGHRIELLEYHAPGAGGRCSNRGLATLARCILPIAWMILMLCWSGSNGSTGVGLEFLRRGSQAIKRGRRSSTFVTPTA